MSSAFAQRFARYHGVNGGILFRGKAATELCNKYPTLKTMNNALWAAPAWKWGLAIVPLYAVLSGSPPEKVDFNNALALTGTGAIWAYYSMLVRPKSYGLFSVSVALVACNGWNALRRWEYDQQQKKKLQTTGTTAQDMIVLGAQKK